MRWMRWLVVLALLFGSGCGKLNSDQNKNPSQMTEEKKIIDQARESIKGKHFQAQLQVVTNEQKERMVTTCVNEDVHIRYLSEGKKTDTPEMIYLKRDSPFVYVKAYGSWTKEKLASKEVVENFRMLCELTDPNLVLDGMYSESIHPISLKDLGQNWQLDVQVDDQNKENFYRYLGKVTKEKMEGKNRRKSIHYRITLSKGDYQVKKIERRGELKDVARTNNLFEYNSEDFVEVRAISLPSAAIKAPVSRTK